jgi:GNAT superfamily N-acetyltransferase
MLDIRDLTPDDIGAWADLLRRVNATDSRVVAWDPEVLRGRFTDDFAMKGPHSLAGAWLDGKLVGYARVRQDAGAESRLLRLAGAVDPGARRQGIGTQLMRWSLATAKEWTKLLGPVDTIVDAALAEKDLQKIVAQLTFEKAATFVEMERPLAADHLPAEVDDLVLVPYTVDMDPGTLAVHQDVHGADSESEFRAILAKQSFRPDLSRLALDPRTRAVIGYLLVQHSPGDDQGWIDAIAVRRSERGRQVTAALVASTLRGFVDAGLVSAGLGMTLNDTVMQDLKVCDQLGFTTNVHWSRYVLRVDPADEAKLSVRQVADLNDYELRQVAGWIAVRNRSRESYIAYLGTTGAQILAELNALSPGAMVAQLHHQGRRVGLMMAEWDPSPASSRAWLHGPWAAHDRIADVLLEALKPHIPSDKHEWESFIDTENQLVTDFAARHKLLPDGGFDIHRFARGHQVGEPVNPVLPYEDKYFDAFEKLHYAAHPDTHLTAARIVAEGVALNLVFHEGVVRGYITYKFAAGESIARIEHMSTDPAVPADVRKQVRMDLLTFALHRMFENPNVGQVEIVTRSTQADNALSEVGFEVIRSTALYRIVPRLTHLLAG